MIVRAPGKVVLSGAYAVLRGSPAIVSAVDRYVVVDTARAADRVTPEVAAALATGWPGDAQTTIIAEAPHFDASALRENDRKLGLGSSAAILVASLAALAPESLRTTQRKHRLFEAALRAHRKAQGGGSGVDVVASTYGGMRKVLSTPNDVVHEPWTLPSGISIELFACPTSASTAHFISQVEAWRAREPAAHAELFRDLDAAARAAVQAGEDDEPEAFIDAIARQHRGLRQLGSKAGIPIVTAQVAKLQGTAEALSGAFLPAGAGGGDIAFWVGSGPAPGPLREQARALEHQPLRAKLAAQGVHEYDRGEPSHVG